MAPRWVRDKKALVVLLHMGSFEDEWNSLEIEEFISDIIYTD